MDKLHEVKVFEKEYLNNRHIVVRENADEIRELSLRVGNYLLNQRCCAYNILLANMFGRPIDLNNVRKDNDLNPLDFLLDQKKPKKKGILASIFGRSAKLPHIGSLCFSGGERIGGGGASFREKWVIRVYGRDNLPMLKKIAEDLAEIFEIQINVCLIFENNI